MGGDHPRPKFSFGPISLEHMLEGQMLIRTEVGPGPDSGFILA